MLPQGPLSLADIRDAWTLAMCWRVLRHNAEAEALETRALQYNV